MNPDHAREQWVDRLRKMSEANTHLQAAAMEYEGAELNDRDLSPEETTAFQRHLADFDAILAGGQTRPVAGRAPQASRSAPQPPPVAAFKASRHGFLVLRKQLVRR